MEVGAGVQVHKAPPGAGLVPHRPPLATGLLFSFTSLLLSLHSTSYLHGYVGCVIAVEEQSLHCAFKSSVELNHSYLLSEMCVLHGPVL